MKNHLLTLKSLYFLNLIFKRKNFFILILGTLAITYSSCKKEVSIQVNPTLNKESIVERLKAAGFNIAMGFVKYKDGYIVEGDIFITDKHLDEMLGSEFKKGLFGRKSLFGKIPTDGKVSHYRTDDLLELGIGTRNVKIYLKSEVTHLQSELEDALSRFNTLGLRISFSRVTSISNADIVISGDASLPYYMVSGFPSSGNPYNEIIVNTSRYHTAYYWYDTASTFAHEIGHAIGFRHTDYMDRSYSCGGSPSDEGSAGVGNVHVPGTPTTPAYESFMLACVANYDRPFTSDDVTAIQGLYGYNKTIYIKLVPTLNFDNSYGTTFNDYVDISTNFLLEFYKDPARTIPATTSNYFYINVWEYTGATIQATSILIPNGLTEYDLGDYHEIINREFGTDVLNNTSGKWLISGPLYYY